MTADIVAPWAARGAAVRVDGAGVGLTADDVALLHATHFERLSRGLAAAYRDPQVAEDAVQEAFLTVHRKRDEMRYDQVVGYVRTVAVNYVKDVLRGQGRERDVTERGSRLGLLPGEDLGPYLPVDRAVDEWTVRQAVDRLPVKYREVIVAHYFWDMPDKEIAKMLGIRAGSVRSRLNRSRTVLKQQLGQGE